MFTTDGDKTLVVNLEFQAADETGDPGGGFDSGGTGGSFDGGSGGFETPSFGSTDIPVGGLPTPGASDPGTTPTSAPPAAPRTIASTSPNILGNLPGGLVLAVPLFIALLGLLSYSLGPAGDPVAATRQRGVSRALAARATAGPTRSPSSPEIS